MRNRFTIVFLEKAEEDIDDINNEKTQAKIIANIKDMETNIDSVYIKNIDKPIMELKINKYRVIFAIFDNYIYIISIFLKKTQKTPVSEINYAKDICNSLIKYIYDKKNNNTKNKNNSNK